MFFGVGKVWCNWPHMRRHFKFIVTNDNGNCGERCLLAWKFIRWAFAKTLYSRTFISLLNTFSESKESLKNWRSSLEANFQTIEAQSLLVKDGIWLIRLYVKFMLQIKIILIGFCKCILQSISRVPEKTYNIILLLFWQPSSTSHIRSSLIYGKKQHQCFQKRKQDILILKSFASSIRN